MELGVHFYLASCIRLVAIVTTATIYFHLYGLSVDDIDYIMETFPIVKRNDERKYGEYRTKRVILDCYEAMVESIKTGRSYQSLLYPPPAHPKVAQQLS